MLLPFPHRAVTGQHPGPGASSRPGCEKPPRSSLGSRESRGEQDCDHVLRPQQGQCQEESRQPLPAQQPLQAGARRQGLLQEHAGLRLVSRWQSPPAALQSSLVALWGPQGLPETPCPAPALPATRAAAEHPAALRSREKRARRSGLTSGSLFSGLRGFCCSSARGWGCAFLLVLEHLPRSSPEGVAGRACWVFRIN